MDRYTQLHIGRVLAATTFAIAMSGVAIAGGGGGFSGGGGGHGGDNGDSSMNPFTGDSYAYFHGGHNLGEQGTIRPNRPNPRFSTAQPDANAPATASSREAPATASSDEAQATQPRASDATQPSASR